MLESMMRYCNNYFHQIVMSGTFKIEEGVIAPLSALEGQYFRIVGSVLNDGVYQYPACKCQLQDEEFKGLVYLLAVPRDFLKLAERIEEWQSKVGDPSMFTAESFGGYSYTRASDGNGGAATWESTFRNELKKWRKLP